jgi:hypothetical protein
MDDAGAVTMHNSHNDALWVAVKEFSHRVKGVLWFYSYPSGRVREYALASVRNHLEEPQGSQQRSEDAAAAYAQWRAKNADFMKAHADADDETLIGEGRRLVEGIISDYGYVAEKSPGDIRLILQLRALCESGLDAGVDLVGNDGKVIRMPSPPRGNHCYACKRSLPVFAKRCVSCGWAVCACGACGCQYAGR